MQRAGLSAGFFARVLDRRSAKLFGLIQPNGYPSETTERDKLTINDGLLLDISGRDVLLGKEGRQEVDARPDFAGFHILDEFVVGYGLDYGDLYRNLPHVAALDQEDIEAGRSGLQSVQ